MHCNACYNVIQHGRLIRMYVLCTYFLNLPSLKNFYPITRLSAYYYHYQPIVQYHVKKSFLSPSPFPLDFGFGIWDLDLGLDLGLTILCYGFSFLLNLQSLGNCRNRPIFFPFRLGSGVWAGPDFCSRCRYDYLTFLD